MRDERHGFRACVFPLLEALGWQGDRGVLDEYLVSDDGPDDLEGFRNVMASVRYGGSVRKTRLDRLKATDLPCLFVSADGRPLVVVDARDGSAFGYDGTSGSYRTIPAAGARGSVATFGPLGDGADSILASRSDWLWAIAERFKSQFSASLWLSLILGCLSILYPILISTLYGQMGIKDNAEGLLALGIGAIVFLAADSGFRYLRSSILDFSSLRSGRIIGDEIFRRLLAFQASYTEPASTESQVRRIKDLRTVSDFIGGSALAALFDLPFVVIMIVWLVSVGGSVALVPALGLVAFIAASALAYAPMKKLQAAGSARRGERMDLAAAVVAGADDIAAAGMRDEWASRFERASSRSADASYRESCGVAAISAVSGLFVSAGGLATLYVGVSAVLSGRMTSSALVASMMLVWRVLGIARSTFSILGQIDTLNASVQQLKRFMALPQETGTGAFVVPARPPEGDLEFQDVSFRYGSEGYPALYAVTFRAAVGAVTELSGHLGSGRTTALKLALGLYRPQVGRVMIGPFNLRQSDPSQLRRALAYVPEVPAVLRTPLRAFVRGSSGTPDERIDRWAGDLGLIEALGEAGLDLDAVPPEDFERRHPDAARLAMICRACVKESRLYLFDEQRFARADLYEPIFAAALGRLAGTGAVVLAACRDRGAIGGDAAFRLDGGRIARVAGGTER